MCQFEKYVHGVGGSTSKCEKCGTIRLFFGNFIMTVNHKALREVFDVMNKSRLKYQHEVSERGLKTVVIGTKTAGLDLALSLVELDRLHLLLQETIFLLDVEKVSFQE